MKIVEINYLDISKNEQNDELIKKVLKKCFEEEKIKNEKLYVNIVLTNSKNIKSLNKEYRNIDKETDVLSFPMFEKEELDCLKEKNENEEILGDIVISVEKVEKQAIEYEHSFERELSYMVVHGFYHLMGYDHIQEDEKMVMRQKEENVLRKLNILN